MFFCYSPLSGSTHLWFGPALGMPDDSDLLEAKSYGLLRMVQYFEMLQTERGSSLIKVNVDY